MKIEKFQVVCPSRSISGGPESLHSLVALLRHIGQFADMVYHPFTSGFSTPEEYSHFVYNSSQISDQKGVMIILPEILSYEAKRFSQASVAIWWLSTDNFRERKYHDWRDVFRYIKKCIVGQRPWSGARALKPYTHLSKSFYDQTYLECEGLTSTRITGPINSIYIRQINTKDSVADRKNQILYNPNKGQKTLSRLVGSFPEFLFIPLVNYDQCGLISIFRKSKLYIDFGHHPGRERMPREAVACGCCIITGVLGSAANPVDVPIPERFKLNEREHDFTDKFCSLVNNIFLDFTTVAKEFDAYRVEILQEPKQQEDDIRRFLQILESTD